MSVECNAFRHNINKYFQNWQFWY